VGFRVRCIAASWRSGLQDAPQALLHVDKVLDFPVPAGNTCDEHRRRFGIPLRGEAINVLIFSSARF